MRDRFAQRQFLRFLVVGLINTAFGYGVFALLIWLGLFYPLAIGFATLAGIAFNFQTIGRVVFNGAPWSLLCRFVAVYCIVYCVNVGGVAILLSTGLSIYLASAAILPALAVLAFVLNRKFVFHTP